MVCGASDVRSFFLISFRSFIFMNSVILYEKKMQKEKNIQAKEREKVIISSVPKRDFVFSFFYSRLFFQVSEGPSFALHKKRVKGDIETSLSKHKTRSTWQNPKHLRALAYGRGGGKM